MKQKIITAFVIIVGTVIGTVIGVFAVLVATMFYSGAL